jgi:hypothetical protein
MQDIWDIVKRPNVWVIGINEEDEVEVNGIENLFNEIIAEKFLNHGRNMDMHLKH